jgi:ketosteroid isomerase-like protein
MVACLLLSACAQSDKQTASSIEADLAAINEVRQQLIDALISDDVDAIMGGLTGDHLTMPPNEPTPQTLDALRSWHERRIAEFTMDITISPPEIEVGRDWAIDRWSSTMILTPIDSGASIQVTNKGLWIWHRELDGSWKLSRSIWNSDEPVSDNQ